MNFNNIKNKRKRKRKKKRNILGSSHIRQPPILFTMVCGEGKDCPNTRTQVKPKILENTRIQITNTKKSEKEKQKSTEIDWNNAIKLKYICQHLYFDRKKDAWAAPKVFHLSNYQTTI